MKALETCGTYWILEMHARFWMRNIQGRSHWRIHWIMRILLKRILRIYGVVLWTRFILLGMMLSDWVLWIRLFTFLWIGNYHLLGVNPERRRCSVVTTDSLSTNSVCNSSWTALIVWNKPELCSSDFIFKTGRTMHYNDGKDPQEKYILHGLNEQPRFRWTLLTKSVWADSIFILHYFLRRCVGLLIECYVVMCT